MTLVNPITLVDILEAVEAASRGNARLKILQDNDCSVLRIVLNYATSPDITFGVKEIPEPEPGVYYSSPDRDFSWYSEFVPLAFGLMSRQLSGNAAREAIARYLGQCSLLERKWSERILRQDLRLNLDAKAINKALPGTVKMFEVPLATDYAKAKPKDLKGRWAIQPKYDGARCVVVLPARGESIRLLSRTGKEWGPAFEPIRKLLQKYNDQVMHSELWLDTEIYCRVDGRIDFQAVQKLMLAKDGRTSDALEMVVFDAADAKEWSNPQLTYQERLVIVDRVVVDIYREVPGAYSQIFAVPSTEPEEVIDPTPERLAKYSLHQVELGYEGAMARRLDLPVENKRGKRLLKIKSFHDAEAEAYGKVEGTGRLTGTLGALQCRTKEGKEFEIGSGFSDAQRMGIWAMKELPRLVSYKFFEITDDNKPRFPIFRGFRAEKDVG